MPQILCRESHLVVRTNPILLDLLTTPLMLNVLILAFRGTQTIKDLPKSGSAEKQRQIFADYLRRMLISRPDLPSRSSESFQRSLCWLARQMQQRSQTVFYLEQLQPDWLDEQWAQRLYRWVGVYLPMILIGICISVLVYVFLWSGSWPYLNIPVSTILLGGLIGWWQSQRQRPFDNKDVPLSKATVSWMKRAIISVVIGLVVVSSIEGVPSYSQGVFHARTKNIQTSSGRKPSY